MKANAHDTTRAAMIKRFIGTSSRELWAPI
jgi:hypothetical protein